MATPSQSLFQPALVAEATKQAFVKLDPRIMFRNPVMFTVEIGTVVMFLVTIGLLLKPDAAQGSFGYNFTVFIVLFLTLLFANFAEAIAEARGKAQADSLRKTRQDTPAKVRQPDGSFTSVSSAQLQKGQVFVVEAGEIIPTDGEIIEGLATIDESAITGESAPVIREAGGDKSSVTGGTKVLSDRIVVLVTTAPGESFLDKMIALVEGASRQKTPNEIALTILLAGFTLVFVIVCVTLQPFAGLFEDAHCGGLVYCAVCVPDSDYYWRAALGHRHCGHGPGAAGQRHHQERQGSGNGRRHRRAAARQNRHHHHRQPQGDPLLARARRELSTSWWRPLLSARCTTKRPKARASWSWPSKCAASTTPTCRSAPRAARPSSSPPKPAARAWTLANGIRIRKGASDAIRKPG